MSETAIKEPVIYLGEQRVKGVWFLPVTIEQPTIYRVHRTQRRDIVHVSTDDVTRTGHIRDALIEQITNAKHKVLFCSFLFADDRIVRALCEAAERLHGGVYVLTVLDKHLRAEVLDEPDSDVDANTAKLQERAKRHDEHLASLACAGAWLRSVEDCHAKFCVVDDACAIVTSANATQEAYESNPEDGLLLLDKSVAHEFGRLFAYVWRYLATLESVPGVQLDVHSLDLCAPAWHILSGVDGVHPVTTLRSDEASLLAAAIEVIDRAQEHLAIASYSFMGMEHHPIGDALARAIERKVRIDLLVQPRNHIDEQRISLAWLLDLGPGQVRLCGQRRTHTKSIVADGQTVLLWTGNLESRHGWDNGIEVGIVVEDAGVASAVSAWTADVMQRHTHVALNSPSIRELVAAGQPLALPGEWTLSLSSSMQTSIVVDVLSHNPVELLEVDGSQVLRCGNELLFDICVDEVNRRIDVVRTRKTNLMGCSSKGWLAESVVRVVGAPVRPSTQGKLPRKQHPQHNSGKTR
ncbi:MAG: phosphatidylserine/phosphatidylglycerophosphate/cardiolipin synthase family protein [Methylococcales bacterium]|nr:phosphatidylserine/phosphatidylglycerophosphate/cardiolipin synthase family protein [Methylococcales bacterium]